MEVMQVEDSLLQASWRRVARRLDSLACELEHMSASLETCGYPVSAVARLDVRGLARLSAPGLRGELLLIYEAHLGNLGLQTGPGVGMAMRIGLAQRNIQLVLAWQAVIDGLDQHLLHQERHRKFAN